MYEIIDTMTDGVISSGFKDEDAAWEWVFDSWENGDFFSPNYYRVREVEPVSNPNPFTENSGGDGGMRRTFIRQSRVVQFARTKTSLWVKATIIYGPKGTGIHETLECVNEKEGIFKLHHRLSDVIVPITDVTRRNQKYPVGTFVRFGHENQTDTADKEPPRICYAGA